MSDPFTGAWLAVLSAIALYALGNVLERLGLRRLARICHALVVVCLVIELCFAVLFWRELVAR